jgi:hypothetical protein
MKDCGAKGVHQEPVTALGEDAYGVSQIKYGSGSFEAVICPASTFRAPDDRL